MAYKIMGFMLRCPWSAVKQDDKLNAVERYGYASVVDFCRAEYPTRGTAWVARVLGMSMTGVRCMCKRMGLEFVPWKGPRPALRTAKRRMGNPCYNPDHVIDGRTERYVKWGNCIACQLLRNKK